MIHKLEIKEKGGAFHGLSHLQLRIITEINRLSALYSIKNGFSFDSIYMPHTIINIISDSRHFHVIAYDDSLNEESRPIGVISGMSVYMGFDLKRTEIKLCLSKDKSRNLKIENIISKDHNSLIFEIVIEVDSDLI
jgi:hypothetical protein